MTARRILRYILLAGLLAGAAIVIGSIADGEFCCRYGWCGNPGDSLNDCLDRVNPPYANGDGC